MATGLRAPDYAKRHFEQANAHSEAQWGHRIIGTLEHLPVIGALIAIIERICAYVYDKLFNSDDVCNTGNPLDTEGLADAGILSEGIPCQFTVRECKVPEPSEPIEAYADPIEQAIAQFNPVTDIPWQKSRQQDADRPITLERAQVKGQRNAQKAMGEHIEDVKVNLAYEWSRWGGKK